MTAVEWLFSKLWDEPKDKFTWYSILNQAKQMEKQQIIDSRQNGIYAGLKGYGALSHEEYYNETYGSKGSDATSSQKELSDEEIYFESSKLDGVSSSAFEMGMKRYRELLKQRL